MVTKALHSIRNGIVVIGVCAALAGGFGIAADAEARVKGPRNSEQAQVCGWLQDQWDIWSQKYHDAPFGSAAESEALDMMESILGGWNDEGCDSDYGSIGVRPVKTQRLPLTGVVVTNASR
jgi:hypothetical protein